VVLVFDTPHHEVLTVVEQQVITAFAQTAVCSVDTVIRAQSLRMAPDNKVLLLAKRP
jgi:hypothetical protein